MKQKIDLRGLLCPEPVLRTKRLLDDPDIGEVEALVDDEVCVNNLERLSSSLKASSTVLAKQGFYLVRIERLKSSTGLASAQPANQARPEPAAGKQLAAASQVGTVILLSKDTFGDGDPELSRTLINLFLQTVLEAGQRPRAILMANSGVQLIAPGSPAFKVLDDFRAGGCEVLACGLCLEFYGLKDKVPKEQITNMFAIQEYLFAADKVLSP